MHADVQHLSWLYVFVPSILIAAILKLDNKYLGPYFAIVDVVFNDFGSGYKWNDREIILSFARRTAWVIVTGLLLSLFHYQLLDIVGVFTITGILLVWPAFGHPLPVYARKSDWQVLLVWLFYILSIVAFGLFGATCFSLVHAITGQSPAKFVREALLGSAFYALLGFMLSAFRVPLQRSLWKRGDRRRRPPSDDTKASDG